MDVVKAGGAAAGDGRISDGFHAESCGGVADNAEVGSSLRFVPEGSDLVRGRSSGALGSVGERVPFLAAPCPERAVLRCGTRGAETERTG
jgi:hypothetical protein